MFQIFSKTSNIIPIKSTLLFIILLLSVKGSDCQVLQALESRITFEKISAKNSSRYKIDVDLDIKKPSKGVMVVPLNFNPNKNTIIINGDTLRRTYRNVNPKSTISFKQNPQNYSYLSKNGKSISFSKTPLKMNKINIDVVSTGKITIDGDSCACDNLSDKIDTQIERKGTDILSIIFDGSVRMGLVEKILKQIEIVLNRLQGISGPVLKPSFEINNAVVLNMKPDQILINNIEVRNDNMKHELEKQLHELDFNRLVVMISVESSLERYYELKEELASLDNPEIYYLTEK